MGELKRRISSREYVEWLAYLELEVNAFHREDYYLAQIAEEVRRSYVKSPRSVAPGMLRIQFTAQRRAATTREAAAQASKRYWLGAVGLRGDGTQKPPKAKDAPAPRAPRRSKRGDRR